MRFTATMPRESFPTSRKINEQRTDPGLDRIHAERAEFERKVEFERLALLAKIERLKAERVPLAEKHKSLFGKEKGWQEQRARKGKVATIATTVALTAAAIRLGQDEKKEKILAPKTAALSKPSKHSHKQSKNPTQVVFKKGIHAPEDSTAAVSFTKDTIERMATSHVGEFPVTQPAPGTLDTFKAPDFTIEMPREAEDIARAETSKVDTFAIGEAVSRKLDTFAVPALPEIHIDERFENATKIDKAATMPVKPFDTKHGEFVTPHEISVPAFELPHTPEDISYVRPIGVKKFDESHGEMPHFSKRNVPELPPIVMDSIVAPVAPAPVMHAPAKLPEGWVGPKPGDTIDSTTIFNFDDIDSEATPKPKAKEKKAPAETPAAAPKHSGIQVINDIDHPNEVFAPKKVSPRAEDVFSSKPSTRMDSLYQSRAKAIGDTSEAAPYDVTIQPGMEKFLHATGDTLRIDTLPNGAAVAETFNGKGFKLGEHKTEYLRDMEKRVIAGGFTVPEILKYRIDDNAWEKLQSHGLRAQRHYLDRVESKENIGPWLMPDKANGAMLVFNEDNTLLAEVPFLFGKSKGEGLNTFTTENDPNGKTTPAKEYYLVKVDAKTKKTLSFGHAAEKYLWEMIAVMPDGTLVNQGLALHGEISKDIEGQEKDIHSTDGSLHEKTIGCMRVDAKALEEIFTHNRYVADVLPEDPTLSYDPKTGKLERLSDKEIRKMMNDGIERFWNENLVLYNLETEEVKKGKNGVAEHVSTYHRDKHADEKIVAIKKDISKVKVPRFMKR